MDFAMTEVEAATLPGLDSGLPRLFENLYEMYRPHVYRFARALTGDPEEAEDLFQETWVRAARAFGKKPQAGDIRAWLFTIAANLHKDSLRKKRVRKLFWLEKSRARDSRRSGGGSRSDGEGTTAPDDTARTEFRMCLHRAIGTLKPGERRVFILKEIEGFKHREIAEVLAIPENTVRSRHHRAVRNLQEELRRLGIESPPREEGWP